MAGTRKTVPGAKALSIKALVAGGAVPHRLSLSETILIFAEHRAFLGALTPAETVARVRQGTYEKKIVVEVSSIEEGVIWAEAGADVIQTEKFTPAMVSELAARLRVAEAATIIAAAGGIGADSAGCYVEAGARGFRRARSVAPHATWHGRGCLTNSRSDVAQALVDASPTRLAAARVDFQKLGYRNGKAVRQRPVTGA